MADAKLSALTELAATPASDDEVYIRDVSEVAADESKRITVTNLMSAAGGASIATGTYSGNDTIRTIATGFKCSFVKIFSTDSQEWSIIPSRAYRHNILSNYHHATPAVSLHASDGFTIGDDEFGANDTGVTYYYWAISE